LSLIYCRALFADGSKQMPITTASFFFTALLSVCKMSLLSGTAFRRENVEVKVKSF